AGCAAWRQWPAGLGPAGPGRTVSRVLFTPDRPRRAAARAINPLGLSSPTTSSSLPATQTVRAAPRRCLTLLRPGVAVPPSLRSGRWALTPPFHPYLCRPGTARAIIGGLFSVALSIALRRPGVT